MSLTMQKSKSYGIGYNGGIMSKGISKILKEKNQAPIARQSTMKAEKPITLQNMENNAFSIRDFYPEGFSPQLANSEDDDSQQTGSFMTHSQDHSNRKLL